MPRQPKKKKPKSVAELIAYDNGGQELLKQSIPFEKYYEGINELIDSSAFRKARGIVRVIGKVYDSRGVLVQNFENEYGSDGSYKTTKVLEVGSD